MSQVSNFGSISTLNRQKVTILEIVRAKLLPRLEKSKHENKQKPLGLFGLETCLNLNHFDQNEARECCNRHSAFPCSLCLAIVPALLALAPLFSIGIYTGFSVGFSKSSTYSSFSFYTVPSYPTSFLKNATTNCYDKSGKWSTTGPNQPRLICYAKPLIAMTSTRSPSEIADQTVPETCTPVIPAITDTKTNYLGSQPGSPFQQSQQIRRLQRRSTPEIAPRQIDTRLWHHPSESGTDAERGQELEVKHKGSIV